MKLTTNDAGDALHIIGCMTDITEEKESRQALEESEQRFKFIVEGYPLPVVVVDVESAEIIYESEAATNLFGRDWTATDKPLATDHYADPTRRFEFVAELREHGEVRDFEFPTRRADGSILQTFATSRRSVMDGREISITSITDRTEHTRREQDLKQARETLEEAIEALSEGFSLYDAENRLVMCNEQFKMFNLISADLYVPGAKRADILKGAVARGQFPMAVGREEEWMARRKAEGRVVSSLAYQTADGSWFERTHRPTRQGGLVVTLRDITERRNMEQALRDSEAMVRRILEGCPLPIQMTRQNGSRIYESPASAELFGSATGTGETVLGCYASEADFEDFTGRLNETGRVDDREYRRRRSDGSEFWAAQSGRLIDFQGEEVVVSCTIDLTERKEMEAALRESEAIFRRVLDACPLPITMYNINTSKIMYETPAAKALFGDGQPLIDGERRNRWASLAERDRYLEKVRRVGPLDGVEAEYRRADGTMFPGAMSARLIDYRGDEVVVSSVFDLSELRAVEDEMKLQREILHQSEKLSAFGEMLAGVSHELNNPLSVLLGQAVMLKDSASDPKIQARAEKLYDAADRCARIVKTFLAMARQRPTELKSLNVNELVENALEVTAYFLRSSDIEILPDLEEEMPTVNADADQILQVLTNLVINAEQALHENTNNRRLKIRTRYRPRTNEVVIKIKDNGPGIPEKHRSRIFDPLFTTKEVGAGTGIGLALCHRIVDAHGGTIVLESKPGEGAAFAIRLPAEARGRDDGAAAAALATDSDCYSILVIDDEPEVAMVLGELLEADGHRTMVVQSGREGLELLRQRAFHMIFCDIRMPTLDGPAFYKALTEAKPQMVSRLAFVTGDYLSEHARRFLEGSACPYIEKPASREEIRRIVGELCRPPTGSR